MADLPSTRLGLFPGPILEQRSRSRDGVTYLDTNSMDTFGRDQLAIDSRVEDADTALLTSNGATVSSTVIQIDEAAGFARVAGTMGTVAALADQPVVGTSQWIYSALLDGEEPAIMADANGYHVAMCLVLISGALQLVAVFGAEVTTVSPPLDPTGQECRDALALAAARSVNPLTGLDPDCFLVVGRFTANRAGAVVTLVHTAAASDDDLKAERLRGYSLAGS